MSPLQSYSIEIIKDDAQTRVVGAAVSAEQRRAVDPFDKMKSSDAH